MKKEKEVLIRAEGIKKYYKTEQVLDVKEFILYKHSFNFLLGPNGSGKTTLLNILSFVDEDYSGNIYYHNRLIKPYDEEVLNLRRRFSIIWQNPYLYKGSVEFNIGLPLRLRKIPRKVIKKRVNEICERLDITHLLKKKNNELSGGERQKVSIARALITDPEILFIDEPTTSLDQESNTFYNQLFKKLISQERTILLITHDLTQVKKLADFITVLKGGKVIISGNSKEVLSNKITKEMEFLGQVVI